MAPFLKEGLEIYRRKSPHKVGSMEEVLTELESSQGDELFVVLLENRFGGFLSFRVGEVDGEIWGTIGLLFLTDEAQKAKALPKAAKQLEELLRGRGCTVMNYMTAREGFRRLAPSLGFKPRIIEWMKEL